MIRTEKFVIIIQDIVLHSTNIFQKYIGKYLIPELVRIAASCRPSLVGGRPADSPRCINSWHCLHWPARRYAHTRRCPLHTCYCLSALCRHRLSGTTASFSAFLRWQFCWWCLWLGCSSHLRRVPRNRRCCCVLLAMLQSRNPNWVVVWQDLNIHENYQYAPLQLTHLVQIKWVKFWH